MIHEKIYQTMINYNPIEAHHSDVGFYYRPYKKILEIDIKEYYQDLIDNVKMYQNLIGKNISLSVSALASNSWNTFSGFSFSEENRVMSAYREYLVNCAKQNMSFDEIKIVADAMVENKMFMNSMENLRKSFVPQNGYGSQDENYDLFKNLADVMKEVCDEQLKQYEEFCCETGCENCVVEKIDYLQKHNLDMIQKWKINEET